MTLKFVQETEELQTTVELNITEKPHNKVTSSKLDCKLIFSIFGEFRAF